MEYLIEVTGRHRATGALRTFRFATPKGGFRTRPSDMPPDAYFRPFVLNPGNYRRTLFGSGGRTSGVASVDRGVTVLNNMGGPMDDMLDYAFDGYEVRISGVASERTPFAERRLVSTGTMEQAEVSLDEVTLRLRSRLAVLDVPIQPLTYAGTTTDGTKKEAEGGEDLKNALRPLIFGAPLNVPAVVVNRFLQVYAIGQRLSAVVRVRDKGTVIQAAGQDFATLDALLSATIASGRWASCLALGLIRFGGNVVRSGMVTVDGVEGATAALRTAGQIVRRILVDQAKLVPNVDFLDADIARLDALAPYEVGYWTGTNRVTTLAAVSFILDSVGASISPDRVGVFRIVRFGAPGGAALRTFDRSHLIEDEGASLARQATGDEGRGIPAKKVILQHSRNHAVVTEDSLAGAAIEGDPAFVAFAKEEWRQEEELSAAVASTHLLAPDMTFQTALVSKDAAKAEAVRRLGLYGTRRDHFSVRVRTGYAAGIDLGDVVALRYPRFGLGEGKSFVVVGMLEDLENNMTTLDVWG